MMHKSIPLSATVLMLLLLWKCGSNSAYHDREVSGEIYNDRAASDIYVVGRDDLIGNQKPKGAAYAYLLFPSSLNDQNRKRYLRTCQAFMSNLQPSDEFNNEDSIIRTYWLLRTEPSSSQQNNCEWRLREYNYPRASQLLTHAGKAGVIGPVLFAKSPANQSTLVFDMSDFNDDNLDRAIRVWKTQISNHPRLWKDGWQQVQVRELVRNNVLEYSDAMLNFLDLEE